MIARASASRRMLFQSGSRTTSNVVELLKILLEEGEQSLGLRIVGSGVLPRCARIEERVRHAGHVLRHFQTKYRLAARLHVVQLPGERRADHRQIGRASWRERV